jgi:hypothetical protein
MLLPHAQFLFRACSLENHFALEVLRQSQAILRCSGGCWRSSAWGVFCSAWSTSPRTSHLSPILEAALKTSIERVRGDDGWRGDEADCATCCLTLSKARTFRYFHRFVRAPVSSEPSRFCARQGVGKCLVLFHEVIAAQEGRVSKARCVHYGWSIPSLPFQQRGRSFAAARQNSGLWRRYATFIAIVGLLLRWKATLQLLA